MKSLSDFKNFLKIFYFTLLGWSKWVEKFGPTEKPFYHLYEAKSFLSVIQKSAHSIWWGEEIRIIHKVCPNACPKVFFSEWEACSTSWRWVSGSNFLKRPWSMSKEQHKRCGLAIYFFIFYLDGESSVCKFIFLSFTMVPLFKKL